MALYNYVRHKEDLLDLMIDMVAAEYDLSAAPSGDWRADLLALARQGRAVAQRQPTTLNLKTNVHTQPVGQRPIVELEPTDHPLAVEQRTGITLSRVQQIAEALLHPEAGS